MAIEPKLMSALELATARDNRLTPLERDLLAHIAALQAGTTRPEPKPMDQMLLQQCQLLVDRNEVACTETVADLLAHIAAQDAELQQLRAAKAADRERVWALVLQAVREYAAYAEGNPMGGHFAVAESIASRVADALAVPGRPSLSDTDRRTLEWLRGVMAYTADGDSGGMAARANATIDRLLSDRPAPPRPSLSDTDRRHLVALRSFIAGIDGQHGHGNDWSAELALLDRLLESP